MYWEKKSRAQIAEEVFAALKENLSYSRGEVLGFPGSFLDREVFPNETFLREHPYLSCLRENPNHIGCHTVTQGELVFRGTQKLELELLRLCAEELFEAQPKSWDGYVCSGGTECNIEALWIQRNYVRDVLQVSSPLAVLCSADTHYSIAKGCDLLGLSLEVLPVEQDTRQIRLDALTRALSSLKQKGVSEVLLVLNMGTTMFGSVDAVPLLEPVLAASELNYRFHIDAAFGGFLYPFTAKKQFASFAHPKVESVSLDGHKMLQAPYGTGVFLVRKGRIESVNTETARYVHGGDYTLCGSRSGANAVALWMILQSYGAEGGKTFLRELLRRTDRLCERLDALNVRYFRAPEMNVVTLRAGELSRELAMKFFLVPDTHEGVPEWWKIVVMDHVEDALIDRFCAALATEKLAM